MSGATGGTTPVR